MLLEERVWQLSEEYAIEKYKDAYRFETSSGIKYEVDYKMVRIYKSVKIKDLELEEGDRIISIEFFRRLGRERQYGITGTGDVAQVMKTAVKAISMLLSDLNPKAFMFSVKEKSREKLYDTILKYKKMLLSGYSYMGKQRIVGVGEGYYFKKDN